MRVFAHISRKERNMKNHYYIGEGPEADALVAEVREKDAATAAAHKTLCEEYESDGLILSRHRKGKPAGLGFKEKHTLPFLKGEMPLSEGYAYYPRLNCKAGKELAAKLNDPALEFSVSDYITKKLKVVRWVAGPHAASRTGMAMYMSAAGIVNGKLLVTIPGGDENAENGGGDPMPIVPAWLREVKESEWLAAQGK